MFIYKSADLLQPGKGIGIAKNINGCNTTLHIHDYIEIVYVVSGKSVHCIDDVSYKVGRGDVLFINYGSSHAISECEDFLYYNIYFSPKIISDGIPAILICGDSDKTVPYVENGKYLSQKYRKSDVPFVEILKKGCDHHPHGLDDLTPLIEFTKKYYVTKA